VDCTVEVVDLQGVKHEVDVQAESLFEAAARGVAALKRCSFPVEVKSPMELLVRVRAPETRHFLQFGKVEAWLASSGAPREQALKGKLRELLQP
jgi:hypothetical protein